jgi:hypothetical protein
MGLPTQANLGLRNLVQIQGANPRPNGRVWYVGNSSSILQYQQRSASDSGATNQGLELLSPFSTTSKAISSATTGRGDTVLYLPGHTESIASAAAIAASKNAMLFKSMDRQAKATFTWATLTTATWTVAGADVTFEDVNFVCSKDELAKFFAITGARCTFRRCRFTMTATSIQTITAVDVGTGADDCTIEDCEFFALVGAAAAGGTQAINVSAAVDKFICRRNKMIGYFTANVGGLKFAAAATNVDVDGNFIRNDTASGATDACISVGANAVTGVFRNNMFQLSTDGAVAPILASAGTYSLFNNFVVNNSRERGLEVGTQSA